jgi:hypothetical protein
VQALTKMFLAYASALVLYEALHDPDYSVYFTLLIIFECGKFYLDFQEDRFIKVWIYFTASFFVTSIDILSHVEWTKAEDDAQTYDWRKFQTLSTQLEVPKMFV